MLTQLETMTCTANSIITYVLGLGEAVLGSNAEVLHFHYQKYLFKYVLCNSGPDFIAAFRQEVEIYIYSL